MRIDRRGFLRLAGLSTILGLGGKTVFEVMAPGALEASGVERSVPGGKRWAMVIDVKKCLENDVFDACREVCHRIHNVPDIENPKHEIKWIWKEEYEHTFPGQQHPYIEDQLKSKSVFVLCNHCDKPPCVRVCPTKATFQREDGIVLMDMHRCFGCRFCMAACPYGSRSFNWKDPRDFVREMDREFPTRSKGVVEKCNFCAERLAKGLIPACVEACSNKELVFGDINDPNSEVREMLRTNYTIRRKPELGTKPQIYYIV